jgi:hypothetical protein
MLPTTGALLPLPKIAARTSGEEAFQGHLSRVVDSRAHGPTARALGDVNVWCHGRVCEP